MSKPTGVDMQEVRARIARAQALAAERAAQALPVQPPAPAAAPAPGGVTRAPVAAAPGRPAAPVARPTSAPRLVAVPTAQMSSQQREIWDIVRAAQLSGVNDLTINEIRRRWEIQTGRGRQNSTVAPRVGELIDGRWLLKVGCKRRCSESGHLADPVYIPAGLLQVNPDSVGRGEGT